MTMPDPPGKPAPEPMRVYVGTDESQYVPTKVLEYSLKKHASGPVVVETMTTESIPRPKDEHNRPRTGFSFCRFTIPERAGFRGRALYLDADMLVFGDVAELWRIPFGAQKVLCTSQPAPPPAWRDHPDFRTGRQFSVMLLDCDRLSWRISDVLRGLDEGRYTYPQLMFDLCLVEPREIEDRIPPEWNHLEQVVPGRTKLLHYTVVSTQPWRRAGNPHAAIWRHYLAEAIAAGAVTRRDLEIGVEKRHLLADLLWLAPGHGSSPAGRMLDAMSWGWTRVKAAIGGRR